MEKSCSNIDLDDLSLLKKFNKRDNDAFCHFYQLYFNKFYHFTSKQFHNTNILPEDVVQDIFASVWEKKSLKFTSISHLTGYIYLSIRNRFKDYSIKQTRVGQFNEYQLSDSANTFSLIIESETLSIVSKAIELLPSECAKVFRMHIEGWDIKDIALELNKSQSTVYNQRKEAIEILKRKISNSAFMSLMSIF